MGLGNCVDEVERVVVFSGLAVFGIALHTMGLPVIKVVLSCILVSTSTTSKILIICRGTCASAVQAGLAAGGRDYSSSDASQRAGCHPSKKWG